MKKVLVVFYLLIAASAFAAHERTVNSLSGVLGSPITTSSSLSLSDQWYPFPTNWHTLFAVRKAEGAVVLRYDDQLRTYTDKKWHLRVTYTVTTTDSAGTVSSPVSAFLEIDYDPLENILYTDRDKKLYPGAHRISIAVTGIDYDEWNASTGIATVTNATSIPAFLNDIYLDLELDVERYYNLSTAGTTTIYTSYASPTNELQVSWNFIRGAESYDLEWLFIDAGDDPYPYSASHNFDWRNATRVNVPNQHYNIPLAFPRGILVMRVRGVGLDWNNYQSNGYMTRGEGAWTTPGNLGSTATYTGARYDLQYGLLPSMNWAYSASYAEDGKRMDGAAFYDGMMRGREAITTVNSDGNVVIGQTLYDFEGRAAAGVLPYPEASQGITFYAADQSYNANDFDADNTIESPLGMSALSGAGNYYSSSSSASGMDAATADAQGYPYSRVTYMNDGTNRPMKSAAAGEDLGMKGSNETQYFYGTTSQPQLDRLFGNEVGYASHYKKNFVIDPNGVVSVSYIDQSGNVIATALAGEAPANLQPIDNPNGNPNTATPLTDDLLVNNGLTTNNNGTESQVTLTVTGTGDYDFLYVLNEEAYCGEGECHTACEDCVYDLSISIINAVSGDSIDVTPSAVYNILKEYAVTADVVGFTITLQPGTYRVQKRLTLNQAHLDGVLADFLASVSTDPATSCLPLRGITPAPCAADCHQACELHYHHDGGWFDDAGETISQSDAEALIAACQQTLCDAPVVPNPCTLKLHAMMHDMSPGGQYFDNLPDKYDYNETTGVQVPNSGYDPNGWLTARDQSADMIALLNDYPLSGAHSFSNWADVRAGWEEGFAAQLLAYHPEYCAWNYNCRWYCKYTPPGMSEQTFTATQAWAYEQATLFETDGNYAGTDGDYFNPLNMPYDNTSAGVTGDNSGYQPYNTSNYYHQDPRFTGDCDFSICADPSVMAQAQIESGLKNFLQAYDAGNSPLGYYSIWYVLDDPDNIHSAGTYGATLSASTIGFFQQLHGDGVNPGFISTTPAAGQVTPYQFFRSVYFHYRTLVIEQGFAANTDVAACRAEFSDDDNYPAYDADGYLVSDDVYPGQTPQGFTILYPRSPLIDLYGTGCSTPSQSDLAALITGMIADAAENPHEINNAIVSDKSCTCEMLTAFAEARNLTTDPSGYDAVAAALNEEYAPVTPYTGTQVGSWLTMCAAEGTDVDDLTVSGFPEELVCIINIGTGDVNAAAQQNCEQENYDLAAYNAYYLNSNMIHTAADAYMAGYIAHCLGSLTSHSDPREAFTVGYELHEYYYTLYYYDQAGNLVKTVPPEGVNLITSSTLLANVQTYRDDFKYGTSTPGVNFTPAQHDMVSRYAYNSLQQPVNASQNWTDNSSNTWESGETSFWYDYLGRMVVSQNSRQAAMSPAGYSYTLYDELGRVYEVGELHTSSSLTADAAGSRSSAGAYYYFDRVSPTTLATWIAGAASKNDVTYTYYDEDPGISAAATAAFANGLENTRNRVTSVVYDDDPSLQYDLYGFSAAGQPGYVSAYFYSYDIHGNVKQVVQETPPLKTHQQDIKSTGYEYDLVSGNVNAVHYQSGQRDEFHHRYEYDADNRLKVAYTSRDSVHWEKESKQFYYQAGGVGRVEVGDKTVQAMDYAFTVNGWLKGMNRNTIGDHGEYQERDLGQDGVNDAGNLNQNVAADAAGFTLQYYSEGGGYSSDYTSVGATAAFEAGTAGTAYGAGIVSQYNGNIAGMATAMLDHGQYGIQVQGRAFTYDQLYRIKSSTAYHMDGTALTNNAWQSSYAQDNRYKETFTYDWNGNIQTVERYAGNTVAGTAVKSDGLTYQYAANSNLLVRINDTQNSCSYADDLDDQGNGTNYVYDAIGELTADNSERISSIEWTPYGKVKAVRKDQSKNMDACAGTEYDDADVEFLYTAGQQRLCKIVKPHKPNGAGITDQTEWIYYWYAYDAGGNVMGVYKQRFEDHGSNSYTVKIDLQEHGVYGSGRTGIRHADNKSDYHQDFTSTMSSGKFTSLSYTGSSGGYNHSHYERTIGYKQYEITNHLGNVLVTVSDKRLPYAGGVSPTQVEWYTADVQSYVDYYVFGAPQTGRSGGSYRYGFNGMESDAEIKNGEGLSYTTEFRLYDPRVGRWFCVDQIPDCSSSPYNGLDNNPIRYTDTRGLWTEKRARKMAERAEKKGYSTGEVYQNNPNDSKSWGFSMAKDDHERGGQYRSSFVSKGWVLPDITDNRHFNPYGEHYYGDGPLAFLSDIEFDHNVVRDHAHRFRMAGQGQLKYDFVAAKAQTAPTYATPFTVYSKEEVYKLMPIKIGIVIFEPTPGGGGPLGDLTFAEIEEIQAIVNTAGRPIEVVGSAAKGTRKGIGLDIPIEKGVKSDIDYVLPPGSQYYYRGAKLPGLDPKSGIITGYGNPYIGPVIRFAPHVAPSFIPFQSTILPFIPYGNDYNPSDIMQPF